MDRSTKQKINKETQTLNHTIPVRSNWYLQNTSTKNNGFHLFLKCTWNILQNRPHLVLWRFQSGILSNVWAPRKKPRLHFWEKNYLPFSVCLVSKVTFLLQNHLLDRLKLVRQTGKHWHHQIIMQPIPAPV